jgi:hypothetical protein
MLGANAVAGKVTYRAVAQAFGMGFTPIEEMLGGPQEVALNGSELV